MGLDITAYRKLTKIDALFNDDHEPVDPQTREVIDCFVARFNSDFPGRGDGLEDGAAYSFADAQHVFSRSYGGYNRWRETLARIAGCPLDYRVTFGVREASHSAAAWHGKVPNGAPFVELVNFADNEGVIGPLVAAKLLRDFIEWDERAKATGDDDFYEDYCDMRRGLEMAADGGALDFH